MRLRDGRRPVRGEKDLRRKRTPPGAAAEPRERDRRAAAEPRERDRRERPSYDNSPSKPAYRHYRSDSEPDHHDNKNERADSRDGRRSSSKKTPSVVLAVLDSVR